LGFRDFVGESNQVLFRQRHQGPHMLAVAVTQVTKAFAGAIQVRTDADMMKRPEPEAVDGKTPATDCAGNLRKGVKGHLGAFTDAQDPGFGPRRTNEPNRLLAAHAFFRM
jgi:hypothetical protein